MYTNRIGSDRQINRIRSDPIRVHHYTHPINWEKVTINTEDFCSLSKLEDVFDVINRCQAYPNELQREAKEISDTVLQSAFSLAILGKGSLIILGNRAKRAKLQPKIETIWCGNIWFLKMYKKLVLYPWKCFHYMCIRTSFAWTTLCKISFDFLNHRNISKAIELLLAPR